MLPPRSGAGCFFLLLYLAWGVICDRPQLARLHLLLWSTAAAAAACVVLLQIVLQLSAVADVLGRFGPGSLLWRMLGLVDLRACTTWQLLMASGACKHACVHACSPPSHAGAV